MYNIKFGFMKKISFRKKFLPCIFITAMILTATSAVNPDISIDKGVFCESHYSSVNLSDRYNDRVYFLNGLIAYAADSSDYRIGSCDWDYDDAGKAVAEWDETAEKTSFVVDIYKGSLKESNKVKKNSITTSKYQADLSFTIAQNGTGNYYFTVYPKKGGTGLKIVSEALEVDSDMLSAIRKAVNYKKPLGSSGVTAGKAINLEDKLGWIVNPNGTWRYKLSKTSFARNQWLNINKKWYYFGADGIMLTGWQHIGGKYYYFNADGDLWQGSGAMKTSASGAKEGNTNISDTNTSVLSKSDVGNVTYSSSTKQITSVTVTFKEDTNAAPGTVRSMEINVPSNTELKSVHYSKQPESWTPGTKVDVTLTIAAINDYQFGSGCKVRGSNATYKSQSGDAFTRTVKFEYTAKTRLAKPQKVYLDNGYVLHWSKVSNASRYNVKIYYDEEYEYEENSDLTLFTEDDENQNLTRARSRSVTVDQNQLDVTDYVEVDEISNVRFVISASASSNRSSYYLASEEVTFTEKQGLVSSSTDSGSITSNNKGEMLYLDTSGSGITGWQDIDGAWYYFETKGVAAGPGWKKIKSEWYFFGDDHKMKTGWVQLDSYWYYLNESTSSGIYGAMLTGSQNINGTVYNLNQSESNGIPYGAWLQ